MKRLGIIVGIDSVNNTKAYRAILACISPINSKQYNWKFDCKILSEDQMKKALGTIRFINAEFDIRAGKIKGSAGDFKRFQPVQKFRPFVIISQLVNSDGKIIGYKIANYDGGVKNIPIKEIIAYGKRANRAGCIPIQNAIFVPDTGDKSAHFKSYPNKPFLEELIIINKNKNTEKRRVNTVKNAKTLNKLEQIYTKEQIEELKIGKKDGVDIRIYANPALSAEQMKVLRKGLTKGLNIRKIAFPEYSVDAMKFYSMELEDNRDISKYLNPKYSAAQIAELSIAVEEGLDVSKMSDPNLSVSKMCERRKRLENNVFFEEDVNREGSWI